MPRDASFGLLLLCFFLSGLAALIYETAWTRELSFVFGTSSLAVSTVLAAYMAGLAVGAAAAARYAHRITRPILAYGLLELGIALAALGIPLAIQGSRVLYVALFGGQGELPAAGGLATGVFYTVCSFAILMVPTAMMGATLPLLARHAVRREQEITGRIGVLYAVNTAGAVAGTLVAAYALLPALGLRRTIWIAAAVNGAVFLAAWALARTASPVSAGAAAPPVAGAEPGARTWVLPLIFGSGVASFSYEVLWVRLLEHVVGANVYAFASMLASFLTGIALGSAVASRLGATPERAGVGFVIAQLGTAGLSLLAFLAIDGVPGVAAALAAGGTPKPLADAAISMLVLFPAATCIGSTFPFAVRLLARGREDASAASARVYSVNTLGTIIGALGSGFFAIPLLGFVGTLTAAVTVNLLVAGAAALALRPRRRSLIWAVVVGLIALALIRPGTPWGVLLNATPTARLAQGEIAYYGVGRSATVFVVETGARWRLVTNGLSESLIDPPAVWHGRSSTERWLGALPSLARPELRSLLLIGLGGGLTLESVPPSVERIDVVELEPEVVAANRALADVRWRDPLSEPRVNLHVNDARNALLLAERRFDAIVSQPSHPWVGGASHLYTREFFELASTRLAGDGVFVQWIGLSFIDDALFRSLLASLNSVFVNVRVYAPPPRDAVLFIASNHELKIERSAEQAIAANPASFAEFGILTPEDVTAWLLLDEAGVREVGRGAPLNRDDHNRLQSEAPRVGKRELWGRLEEFYGPHDPLARLSADEADPFGLLDRVGTRRAKRFAGLGPALYRMRALSGPVEQKIAQAIARAGAGEFDGPRVDLIEALGEAPTHAFGRAALLRLSSDDLADGLDAAELVAPPLRAAEQAVVAGWRLEAQGAGASWSGLDAELARIPARDPLFRDAALLRARWRIASGDPAIAREAVALADQVQRWKLNDYVLRAQASAAAEEYLAALDALEMLASFLNRSSTRHPVTATRAQQVLREIPALPELRRLRATVEARLQNAGAASPSERRPGAP